MADVAALVMDMDPHMISYSYRTTTHEVKQAALNRHLGLLKEQHLQKENSSRDAPAKEHESPHDLALYQLMASHQPAPSSSALRREDAALQPSDAYGQYCLRDDKAQSAATTSGSSSTRAASPAASASAARKRNVCTSCLRPFDDGYYRSNSRATGSSMSSFDLELDGWKVNFSRTTPNHGAAKEDREKSMTAAAASVDGGFVDYTSHLKGNVFAMPVRSKTASASPPPSKQGATAAPASRTTTTTGDIMADYTSHLSGNVFATPVRPRTSSPKPAMVPVSQATAGDIMADYAAFVSGNNSGTSTSTSTQQTQAPAPAPAPVSTARTTKPAAKSMLDWSDMMAAYDDFQRRKQEASAAKKSATTTTGSWEDSPEARAAAGDSMADYRPRRRDDGGYDADTVAAYDKFLRSNHVVTARSVEEASAAAAADKQKKEERILDDDDDDEDTDMDYVDVRDEEYLDFLAANHVVVVPPSTHQEQQQQIQEGEKKKPRVEVNVSAYDAYCSSGMAGNVGPSVAGPPWTTAA